MKVSKNKIFLFFFTGLTSTNSNKAKSSPAVFSPSLNSYHRNIDSLTFLSSVNKSSSAVVEKRPIKSDPSPD